MIDAGGTHDRLNSAPEHAGDPHSCGGTRNNIINLINHDELQNIKTESPNIELYYENKIHFSSPNKRDLILNIK
jgi:hypothetical protein